MVSLVVLAVGLAVGLIPTTARWRFGQSGRQSPDLAPQLQSTGGWGDGGEALQ
jgi:hypothetical protein